MTDVVLQNIGSGFNRSKINNNFDKLEAAINDEVLHLEGGNNTMRQGIDANSQRILNLPDALTEQEPATLDQLNKALASVEGAEGVLPLVQPRQVGDGVATVFASPMTGQTGANDNGFFIALDGVTQRPLSDFSVSTFDGNITFEEAPEAGVLVDITYFKPKAVDQTEADGDSLITAAGTTTSKALADWHRAQELALDNVAAAKADHSLDLGTKVKTSGYHSANDGGGAEYVVVAGGTGTDDGGSHLNMANGNQLALIVSGVVEVSQFGATGDGLTDDTVAIQAAIAHAVSRTGDSTGNDVNSSKVVVDLGGRVHGTTATLYIGGPIVFCNGGIKALSLFVGSTYLLRIQPEAERAEVRSLDLDGGLSGTTRFANLINLDSRRVVLDSLFGIHFPDVGIRVDEGQECKITNSVMREWGFSEAGTADGTLRTAAAYYIQTADLMMSECVGAQSQYPIYVDGPLTLITACHFYNGASVTTTEDLSCVLSSNAHNTTITGCYFDNGLLSIRNNFKQTITGCHYQLTGAGTNTAGIELLTNTPNDVAAGLTVTGCKFNGSFSAGELRFSTTGGGSYLGEGFLRIQWAGNLRADGEAAWYVAKLSNGAILNAGEVTLTTGTSVSNLRSNKSLRLSADYDNDTTSAESEVIFATDGVDRWRVGGAGELLPQIDNSYILGNTTHRLNNVFSNRVTLAEDTSAPTTIAGHAQIFVDGVDGDLKVMFGDGVVKTISIDT